jgi:hypothetical protein
MIKPDQLKEIESYNHSEFPILSVYLGEDTLQAPSEKFLTTQLHSLMHRYLSDEHRNHFEKDIRTIEEYLDNYVPTGRSLVIFTAGDNLWETVSFEFSIPPSISVGTSPNLDPILKSQQKYSKYMVLLIDREKARMFTVEQGEIIEHSDFTEGYVPQNKKITGDNDLGSRTDTISRHTDVMLDRHIDQATHAADKFARDKGINFLIIGGHVELLARIAESLPYDLKNKLAGSLTIDVNLPLNDILIESKKVAANV